VNTNDSRRVNLGPCVVGCDMDRGRGVVSKEQSRRERAVNKEQQ
jgi:hypothetical protein